MTVADDMMRLRAAAYDCGTNSDNPDTCGVCHLHFAACEEERLYDEEEKNTFPACPGARVRQILKG